MPSSLPLSPVRYRRWAPLALALFIAALLMVSGFVRLPAFLVFNDTDEAMRLVQLRDFLAGQSWRDLVPHRLDPSFDVPMHWSRFVDLSMALLYWPLSIVMAPEQAERAMAIIWPPLMLLFCAIPLVMIARRFGGMRAALVTIVLSAGAASLWQFLPGRIDHHSAQMAAALLAMAFTIKRNRPWCAGMAGAMTAFALSLGIETLPYLVVLACFFAADFVWGRRLASVRAYAAALGISAVALFSITVAPRFVTYTACDVLTLNLLAAVVIGAANFLAAASWSLSSARSPAFRFMLCVVSATAAAAVGLAIEPQCVRGVIGTFNQAIRPLWFDHIEEIATAFKMVTVRPDYVFTSFAVPVLTCLAIGLRRRILLKRDDGRVILACFAMALFVALLQMRGAFYANMFAALILGPAIVAFVRHLPFLQRFETAPLVAAALILTAAAVLPSLVPVTQTSTAPVGAAASEAQRTICRDRESFVALAALPPALVLAPIDSGPFILLNTRHAVVSAPYHRFDRGIVLGQSILYKMSLPDAHAAMARRGIAYVVLCASDQDGQLIAALTKEPPSWAKELSPPNAPLRIFRIEPEISGLTRAVL